MIEERINKLFTPEEVGEKMRVAARTVIKWINKGVGGKKLKASRAGNTGRWKIKKEDLDAFMSEK